MANVIVDENALQDIADAIRTKNGTQNTYKPGQMADAIEAIPSGGITPTGTINVTQNGTTDVTQYASANVAVPNSYAAADEGKVVSNGVLVAQTSKNISGNGTVDTTLNNQVVVAVPNSYAASDEGKVVSNGALVAQGSDTVTANGTVDTTLISSLVVNVGGGTNKTNFTIREVAVTNNTPTVARDFENFIFIAYVKEDELPTTGANTTSYFMMFAYVDGAFINKTGNRGYSITNSSNNQWNGNVSNMASTSVGTNSITFSAYSSQNMARYNWEVLQIELPSDANMYSFSTH